MESTKPYFEIDTHELAQALARTVRRSHGGASYAGAGIVDHDVKTSESRQRPINQLSCLSLLGQIGSEECRFSSGGLQLAQHAGPAVPG